MLELALQGDKKYQGWIGLLIICIGVGTACFLWQLDFGLGITGLSRDVSWGFYVAQLTFLVGVAASAVMLVLPYYLHKYKEFGKITIVGEFTAVSSICMCMLFLFVDLGQPMREAGDKNQLTGSGASFWQFLLRLVVWSKASSLHKTSSPK